MDPGGSGARKQIAGIRGAWTACSDSAPWAATSARPAAPQRIDAPMVGGMAEIARVVRRPKVQFLSRRTACGVDCGRPRDTTASAQNQCPLQPVAAGQLAVNGTSMTIHLPAL